MEELYNLYEYIRDEESISKEISSTKRIMLELASGNEDALEYCKRKRNEELHEVNEAMIGEHFHAGMSKREILVNELSQYMYWQIVLDVSKKVSYEDTKVFQNMKNIIDKIDVSKIGETKNVTLDEVIEHDLENMRKKNYLLEVV